MQTGYVRTNLNESDTSLATAKSPTVRRRRLGLELRQLREAAGMTCEQVAERLEWSAAKVSRIETAKVGVRPRDVTDLLDAYGIDDQQARSNLVTLTREARQRGWWWSYSDTLTPGFDVMVGMEAEASAIKTCDAQIVNGLLQTEDYARAVLRALTLSKSAEQIERRVALRMARQQVLSVDDPPHVWSIVDEGALHRRVGGIDVTRGQLLRLVEASELPHITLQVLPFSAGAHAGVDGSFALLALPDPDPEVVFIEYGMGCVFLEHDDQVRQYGHLFDRLRATAMSPDDSVLWIRRLVDELRSLQ